MVLHAVHEDARIRPVGKVTLDRFVGAVGVADEDLNPFSIIASRRLLTSAGTCEICREPATKTIDIVPAYAARAGL
jgi:hypothetical protein